MNKNNLLFVHLVLGSAVLLCGLALLGLSVKIFLGSFDYSGFPKVWLLVNAAIGFGAGLTILRLIVPPLIAKYIFLFRRHK